MKGGIAPALYVEGTGVVAGVGIPRVISSKGGMPLTAGAGSGTEMLADAEVDVVDAEDTEIEPEFDVDV